MDKECVSRRDRSRNLAVKISESVQGIRGCTMNYRVFQIMTQKRAELLQSHAAFVTLTRLSGPPTSSLSLGAKWWSTSLPADTGCGAPVDIRRVSPAWPTSGKIEHGSEGNDGQFDSDEASLWWYVYASTKDEQAAGSKKEVRALCTITVEVIVPHV